LLASPQTQGLEDMALSGAAPAGEHEIIAAPHEIEARELDDESLVERGLEVPVEVMLSST
jgi:hypothetical protein